MSFFRANRIMDCMSRSFAIPVSSCNISQSLYAGLTQHPS